MTDQKVLSTKLFFIAVPSTSISFSSSMTSLTSNVPFVNKSFHLKEDSNHIHAKLWLQICKEDPQPA